MSCAQLHLINTSESCLAIVQGETFKGKAIWHYPADLTGYTGRGQIRRTTANLTVEVLASFVFPPIVYTSVTLASGAIVQRSLIKPQLSASVTAALPATPQLPPNFNLTASRQPDDRFWVYDLEVVGNVTDPLLGEADVIKICAPSFVQVIAEVTK